MHVLLQYKNIIELYIL